MAIIDRHFPGGSGDPTYVLASEEHGEAIAEKLDGDDDVASVAFNAKDTPSGTLPYPAPPAGPLANAEPTVDNGQVLIQATLAYNTDSGEAQDA
ncbi:hypothetical protein [Kocuria atrinae]|uniref:hypothetical protein n=1 Tax=Kocuria atrinae TaxID=592377 RepID=UPI0003070BCC|nr:hypothetical protein [Kocuria atrinae]